ncbi:glycosyl transferase family 90-domain-containing protein [Xylaria intraflava]|nr:glycosyl transferase family 90-domain-containing protein [Xylaria intraflava]
MRTYKERETGDLSTMGVAHRSVRQTTRLRQIFVVSVLCLAIYCFLVVPEKNLKEEPKRALPQELLNNRFLTEDQCRARFPGLLAEVDNEVAKGPFTLQRNPYNLGPLIARIRDGQLYILSAGRKADLSKDMLAHRAATLHQIANALLTWPQPSPSSASPYSHIPDTIIAFNHNDDPAASTFSYSRPADPAYLQNPDGTHRRIFAIPHFSFYAWSVPFIGSLNRAAKAIKEIESIIPFNQKYPRAIWRGTTWFNNPRAGRLRQNLVRAFGGETAPPWADVEALDWDRGNGERNATNALPIEDFCRYKYLIYTEGVTYSGRLQFHNLCASVVLSPPIAWAQPHTHLLRPVFSYTLDPDAADAVPARGRYGWLRLPSWRGAGGAEKAPGLRREPIDFGRSAQTLDAYPAPWVGNAWPVEHDVSEANVVFVAPDWSDLEATVAWLEAHPRIAEGIAARQRALFDGGGYFSPAAEMCYWRGLIRGWSEVVRVEDGAFDDLEEMSWEEFSLKEIHK